MKRMIKIINQVITVHTVSKQWANNKMLIHF